MSTIFLETARGKQMLLLALIICSNIIQARRYQLDTLPESHKIQIVAADSTSATVFSPSGSNGKRAANGSVAFGILAVFLNFFSFATKSVDPAGIAFILSIGALIFAVTAAVRSRKIGNKIPFSSLKEYEGVRKKVWAGAILAVLGLVIAIICIAAFFTFTYSL
jgi:amino acid permease